MELTDSMIESALQATTYMQDSPWTIVGILGAIVALLLFLFFKATNASRKIMIGGMIVLLVAVAISQIGKRSDTKEFIENGEWYVVTDTVDRVMESSETYGNKSYFMVLDKYGNVPLDSYTEAIQYSPGATVYVVVIPDGDGYKGVGIAYKTEDYIYTGDHEMENGRGLTPAVSVCQRTPVFVRRKQGFWRMEHSGRFCVQIPVY